MMNVQESKETETYFMIKIGDSFIAEINTMGSIDNPDEKLLRDLSMTSGESGARKWYFDDLSTTQAYDQHNQEKHFDVVTGLLKKNGINFKVLKTKVTTTVEQEEFSPKANDDEIKEVINNIYKFSMGAGFKISDLMKEIDNRLNQNKDFR
ncbi:hypothetical protein ABE073_04975 [Lederbergia citrisecunda]|uniref:hypothetical protein n=1 Tax=Lederbergia citrisecunda TaxID=2833583 RepID=UPI003D2B91E9